MKLKYFFNGCVAALLLLSGSVNASTLLNVTSTLQSSDPTQLGRMSRNGVASDWSTSKTYPGTLNTTTSYHYESFSLNVGLAQYIQVSIDDPNNLFFASAYSSSYNASSQSINYVADAGTSGNSFGNPRYFQFLASTFSTMVFVVNEATSNGGIGSSFNLLVEGFTDSSYTDVPVPVPSTLVLIGMAALMQKSRRYRVRQVN
jgi:hypothetical protein